MVSSGENSKDVDFTVYGCTKDYFNEYVETVKKQGLLLMHHLIMIHIIVVMMKKVIEFQFHIMHQLVL